MTYSATIHIWSSSPGGKIEELNIMQTQIRHSLHDVYLECGVLVFNFIKEYGHCVKHYEKPQDIFFFKLDLFKRIDSTDTVWLYKTLTKTNYPEFFKNLLPLYEYLYRFILKLAGKNKKAEQF
jgi:hypothetical protein